MLVSLLKSAWSGPGQPALSLPVREPRMTLRPVSTDPEHLRASDVRCLTDWRNRHVSAFLTEFRATSERTARWLGETVAKSPDRLIFMLDDAEGHTFGYMGLAQIDWEKGKFELDGVVRGTDGVRGGMSAGAHTLISWARNSLGLDEARVRVRSDNPGAVSFYSRLGFDELYRRPLLRTAEPGMISWTESGTELSHGPSLIHMTWTERVAHACVW